MSVEMLEKPEAKEVQPPPRRRDYTTWMVGLVLVVGGLLWLLDVVGIISLQAVYILPAALVAVGLTLIIGARDGPHPGLILFGVFLTIAVLAVAVTPPNAFRDGIGERTFVVTEEAALASRYDVGMGELRLDLRDLTLTEAARVEVSVGAGDMLIQLPAEMEVAIDAAAGAGEIDLFGDTADGVSVQKTYVSDGYEETEANLTLDLNVAAGSIEVTR